MAYLVINGTTIPVKADGGFSERPVEIGDRDRAFDGTMLVSRRGQKHEWPIVTTPMAADDADALLADLFSVDYLTVTGDGVGSASCYGLVTEISRVKLGDGTVRKVVSFTLQEA